MSALRTLTVGDNFPDIDAALAWAVQTLDRERLTEVQIELKWFARADPEPNGLVAPMWEDRYHASVSGLLPPEPEERP